MHHPAPWILDSGRIDDPRSPVQIDLLRGSWGKGEGRIERRGEARSDDG